MSGGIQMNPMLFTQLSGLQAAVHAGMMSQGTCNGLSQALIEMWTK